MRNGYCSATTDNRVLTKYQCASAPAKSKGANMGDYNKDSIGEEASGFGQRVKGDVKEATGAVTGDRSLERSGAQEASTGAARQRSNRMVTGLFRDRERAERAYGSLSERGY